MIHGGARLDSFLAVSIARLKSNAPLLTFEPVRSKTMGGLSRLANVIENNHKRAEDTADKLADKLEAAYKLNDEVMAQYDHHADQKKQEGEDALKALQRISNLAPPTNGSDKSSD